MSVLFPSEPHVGRLHSDGTAQNRTPQLRDETGALRRPGQNQEKPAGRGGRALDDRVHALLLRSTEVEETPPHGAPGHTADKVNRVL